MTSLADLWPAAGLRVAAGDLELRWIDDDLLVALADLASRGVHDPGVMPFLFPWTRGTPSQVAQRVVTYQWDARSAVGPDRLLLELAVLRDGVPVGVQALGGSDVAVVRSVETGSWLGLEHQGGGTGTRMRALAVHLAFAGLGLREVTSTAFADNAASRAVSERVGYEPNGAGPVAREGVPVDQRRFRLTRERWEGLRAAHRELLGDDVVLDGVARVREQAGLGGG
jgi:RimJ/RimL family protein N-acetyltransferase